MVRIPFLIISTFQISQRQMVYNFEMSYVTGISWVHKYRDVQHMSGKSFKSISHMDETIFNGILFEFPPLTLQVLPGELDVRL